MLPAQRDQEIEVALPPIPEPEVPPRDHHPDPETGDQKGFDELDRRHGAQTLASKRSSATRSSGSARSVPSFSRSRVRRGGAFSPAKNSCGCGSNVTRVVGNGTFAAERRELPDQRPMAKVHAVEVPDGGHAAVVFGPDVVPAADHLPTRISSPCSGPASPEPDRPGSRFRGSLTTEVPPAEVSIGVASRALSVIPAGAGTREVRATFVMTAIEPGYVRCASGNAGGSPAWTSISFGARGGGGEVARPHSKGQHDRSRRASSPLRRRRRAGRRGSRPPPRSMRPARLAPSTAPGPEPGCRRRPGQ